LNLRSKKPIENRLAGYQPAPRQQQIGCVTLSNRRDDIIILVRMTLNLPDDVYEAARALASVNGLSLGAAVAELVRRGLSSGAKIDRGKPFPSFRLPKGSKPITLEHTLALKNGLSSLAGVE
jgi:hypothetical protein